jgi:hypothetical protein
MIIPQYQNRIEIYLTFTFLHRLLLYPVLNFQIALNLQIIAGYNTNSRKLAKNKRNGYILTI